MKKYLVLIFLVVLFCFYKSTYGTYKTKNNSELLIYSAKFDVSIKCNGIDIVNNKNEIISLNNLDWKNDLGSVANGKIAPGSYSTFNIEIDASKTEFDVDYQILIDEIDGFIINITDIEGTIKYLSDKKIIPVNIIFNGDNDNTFINQNINIPIKVKVSQKLIPICNIYLNLDDKIINIKKEKNSLIGKLPVIEKIGYEFLGWYLDENKIDETFIVQENINLYPKYKYNLLGQIVYFDPVSDNECSKNTFNLDNILNNTSTCYKWRVMSTKDSDKLTLQMDHNLLNKKVWNTKGNYSSSGPVAAFSSLSEATSTWIRVPKLNYTYDTTCNSFNYGELKCISGTCLTGNNTLLARGLRARIISVKEIIDIINMYAPLDALSHNWSLNNQFEAAFDSKIYKIGTNTIGPSTYNLPWLIENTSVTSESHSTSNLYGEDNNGYFTLDPYYTINTYVSLISNLGIVSGYHLYLKTYGLRPVIEINKNLLNYDY